MAIPGVTQLSLITVSPSFSPKSIKTTRKEILARLQTGQEQVAEKPLNPSVGKHLPPQGHYLMALHLYVTLGRPLQMT